jgi:hypothetical protein
MKTKILFAIATLSFLQPLISMAGTQEWFPSPSIDGYIPNSAFRACMENQIKVQGQFGETKIFWLGVLSDETVVDKVVLWTTFCLENSDGYCKQAFKGNIETSDPHGWKNEWISGRDPIVTAKDMGRYVEFRDNKTGASSLLMDLQPCKVFFGIN